MSAVLSPCGQYRYRLDQVVDDYAPKKVIAWIMVNPSTADDKINDATIRKVLGFSRHLGASAIIVGNLFAYRTTDVRALKEVEDPVGPINQSHLASIIGEADLVICAWGAMAKMPKVLGPEQVRDFSATWGKCFCLGTTKAGAPLHPLMVPYAAELQPWRPET
jgi:hypothetical protein